MSSESTSASTTPTGLTQDSIGAASTAKKPRRQTAYYPQLPGMNKVAKPFSRSAAKRESVMTLGSIEHLQYYFTKTGLVNQKSVHARTKGLVPALGAGLANISVREPGEELEFQLPPTPAIPHHAIPAYPPVIQTYETDPEFLLPGVADDLSTVSTAWYIDSDAQQDSNLLIPSTDDHIDVLSLLKTTTRAVRSVRTYVVSLPSESTGSIRTQYKSKNITPDTKQLSLPSSSSPDPLTLIRGSALEVLTVLRELEEYARLPLTDDAYDAQSEGGGSRGGHSRVASPSVVSDDLPSEEDTEVHVHEVDADTSMAFSLVQVKGRYESVPVWQDEDSLSEAESEEQKGGWDQKLVLGSGWLYRQDLRLVDLVNQKKVIATYLDLVDDVLFNGGKGTDDRGWVKEKRRLTNSKNRSKAKKRRTSAGDIEGRSNTAESFSQRHVSMPITTLISNISLSDEPAQMAEIQEEDEEQLFEGASTSAESEGSIDDEDLPEWAQRHNFLDSELDRAHCLLASLLPANLLEYLASSSPRTEFLNSLSSGQLLCLAYNTAVRRSRKPWGYVNKAGIHDIIALEQSHQDKKRGWTFRRTDNLRLWVGALGIRYMIPVVMPSQLLPNSVKPPLMTTGRSITGDPTPILFDAKVVAGQLEGWDGMLESVLLKWVKKVVDERRTDR